VKRVTKFVLGAALAATGVSLVSVAAAAPLYKPTVLVGAHENGAGQHGEGPINNAGQSVVFASGQSPSGNEISYRYDGKGQRTRLGPIHAFQINRWGDVAGTRYPDGEPSVAVVVRADGSQAKVHGFPDDACGGCTLSAKAFGVNDLGQVVGMAQGGDGRLRGYVWTAGVMVELGTFGGPLGMTWGINNKGEAVGGADTADFRRHAFLYRQGTLHDLGTLGGDSSYAFAINDAGQVVGSADEPTGGSSKAFIYENGAMRAIPTPGDGPSTALSINRDGVVVGEYGSVADGRPYIFDGAVATDLNDALSSEDQAVWKITSAFGINDKGHITCTGVKRSDGEKRILVLKPQR
jgi:probable HAF family extracellular repeat protein